MNRNPVSNRNPCTGLLLIPQRIENMKKKQITRARRDKMHLTRNSIKKTPKKRRKERERERERERRERRNSNDRK